MESWTEIRCPACVLLGWNSSRLLLKVYGHMPEVTGVDIQMKCHRCKSIVSWRLGTPILVPVALGAKNNKRQEIPYENVNWEKEVKGTERTFDEFDTIK